MQYSGMSKNTIEYETRLLVHYFTVFQFILLKHMLYLITLFYPNFFPLFNHFVLPCPLPPHLTTPRSPNPNLPKLNLSCPFLPSPYPPGAPNIDLHKINPLLNKSLSIFVLKSKSFRNNAYTFRPNSTTVEHYGTHV
jgi:hypothetical protein